MAWDTTMVTMLRVLINDLDASTYTDTRLKQVIVVSAKYVNQELGFTYDIDIDTPDITPDPVTDEDDAYVNFVILKAACIADQSTFRTKALNEGIKAVLGPASIAVAGNLSGFKTLLEMGPCKTYEELKFQYQIGNAKAIKAVLSPFVGNNFSASWLDVYRKRC